MDINIHQQLAELVELAQQHSPGSVDYKRCITQIYRLMMKSGKIWSGTWKSGTETYYEEALAETWTYVCSHLSEYDPSRGASVITWFNMRLKYRLLEWARKTAQQQQRTCSSTILSGEVIDPLDRAEAPPDALEVFKILQSLRHWVMQTSYLLTIYIKDRPDITAQQVICHRLPPDSLEFKELVARFAVKPKTLENFWQRRCKPTIAEFLLENYPYLAEHWDFDTYLKNKKKQDLEQDA